MRRGIFFRNFVYPKHTYLIKNTLLNLNQFILIQNHLVYYMDYPFQRIKFYILEGYKHPCQQHLLFSAASQSFYLRAQWYYCECPPYQKHLGSYREQVGYKEMQTQGYLQWNSEKKHQKADHHFANYCSSLSREFLLHQQKLSDLIILFLSQFPMRSDW